MKNKIKSYQKAFGLKAAQGVEITPEILAKINVFALRELTAEEIFVRKYLMAHNAVDRDRERFPELLLDDFARTLPGKSLLSGHDRWTLPLGLFFDAASEEMSPDQFQSITSEEAKLPDGVKTVKVLFGWIYLLKSDFNTPIIENIDAGIYRHASIGFRASDLIAIKGPFEQILYWEYVAPGEALEGSIVWLGAQPGATAQKKHGGSDPGSHTTEHDDIEEPTEKGEKAPMKELMKLLARLFPGKLFTEDGLTDELKTAVEDHAKAHAAAEVEKAVKPLNEKIAELTPLAADGKAFRDDLVSKYVANKAKLGEVAETPEAQDKVKAVVAAYPMDFLRAEVDSLEKRVAEKFPAEQQLAGDERRDKSKDTGEGDWKKKNPLVPNEEKEAK